MFRPQKAENPRRKRSAELTSIFPPFSLSFFPWLMKLVCGPFEGLAEYRLAGHSNAYVLDVIEGEKSAQIRTEF